MEHKEETSVEQINASSSKFGFQNENQFVVMDDAKHVIRVDPSDGRNLILENIQNGKATKYEGSKIIENCITAMIYNEQKRSFYTGNNNHELHKYIIETANKTIKKVKDFGKIGIGWITSSYRFMNLNFFGGNRNKIKVLDLSTDKFLSAHLETSIRWIRSLQVCQKRDKQIYLAVSGWDYDYSDDKTDLFNLTNLFPNDFDPENKSNHDDTILLQQSTIKSLEEKNQKLTKEKDSYKTKFTKMHSKYKNLKEKCELLYNQNKQLVEINKIVETESEKNKHQKSKRSTHRAKKSLIGKRFFDNITPSVNTRDLKKDF